MAKPTCIKCGNNRFENVAYTPAGSNHPLIFVVCSGCGGAIGAFEMTSVVYRTEVLEKKIDQIIGRVGA